MTKFVECGLSAFNQDLTIDRRFDAPAAAIKEPDAELVLYFGNHLRDSGLRDKQSFGRFRHASAFGQGKNDVEIAQAEPAADLLIPIQVFSH